MIADYDPSEPKYVPIIVSIVVTILFIFLTTISLIYYFKSALSVRNHQNMTEYGQSFELQELQKWESHYLDSTSKTKLSINEAIYIIKDTYR